ncbi:MAG: RDD family protein [Pseudomonadota bacterium]
MSLPDPDRDPQFYEGVRLRRVIAFAVDCAVIGILMGGIAMIGVVVGLLTLGGGLPFVVTAFALVGIAYRTTMVMEQGGTLGMLLMGIEVRLATGDRPAFLQSLAHAAAFTAMSYLPPALIASMLFAMLNRRGQMLHDLFAGATMINRPV